jgi:tryptophan synthase beta chain
MFARCKCWAPRSRWPLRGVSKLLKEMVNTAFAAYMLDPDSMFFAIGSVAGPNLFPMMVQDFQAFVGYEAKEQFQVLTGGKPDMLLIACAGGGETCWDNEDAQCVAGHGLDMGEGHHSATINLGKPGVIHGMKCLMMTNKATCEPAALHSCASGLDCPRVGLQHSFMTESGQVKYKRATDEELSSIAAFFELSRMEGVIPALELAHGLAHAMKIAKTMSKEKKLLLNMSGWGDKDLDYVCHKFGNAYDNDQKGVLAEPPGNGTLH